MSNRMDPLESLFSDKEPTDEELSANLKEDEKPAVKAETDEDEDEVAPAAKEESDEDDDDVVPDTVPKAVLLKERAKYRERLAKAEGRAEGLKEGKPKEEKVGEEFVPPDPKEDPEGWAKYHENRTEIRILNERMNNSERWAVEKHGEEEVNKAFAWFSDLATKDVEAANKIRLHNDPYGEAVRQFKASQRATNLKDVDDAEINELRSWKKAKAEGKLAEWDAEQAKKGKDKPKGEAKPVAKAKPKPAEVDDEPPPRSLANDQSARGSDSKDIGVGAGEAFRTLFK